MVYVNEDDLGPDEGYSLIKRNKGHGKKSRQSGGQTGGEECGEQPGLGPRFLRHTATSAGENSDQEDAQVRPTVYNQ